MGKESTDSQQWGVVALYEQGVTLDEITARTGVARSTIYYFLSRAGIRPNRQAQDKLVAQVTDLHPPSPEVYAQMMVVIWELQRDVGRLEAERDAARELSRAYRDRLVALTEATVGDTGSIPPLPESWGVG